MAATTLIEKGVFLRQDCEMRIWKPRFKDEIAQIGRQGHEKRLPIGREKDQLSRSLTGCRAERRDRAPGAFKDEEVAKRQSNIPNEMELDRKSAWNLYNEV